jgi:hypothetical protein
LTNAFIKEIGFKPESLIIIIIIIIIIIVPVTVGALGVINPFNAGIKSLCATLPAEIFTGDFNF